MAPKDKGNRRNGGKGNKVVPRRADPTPPQSPAVTSVPDSLEYNSSIDSLPPLPRSNPGSPSNSNSGPAAEIKSVLQGAPGEKASPPKLQAYQAYVEEDPGTPEELFLSPSGEDDTASNFEYNRIPHERSPEGQTPVQAQVPDTKHHGDEENKENKPPTLYAEPNPTLSSPEHPKDTPALGQNLSVSPSLSNTHLAHAPSPPVPKSSLLQHSLANSAVASSFPSQQQSPTVSHPQPNGSAYPTSPPTFGYFPTPYSYSNPTTGGAYYQMAQASGYPAGSAFASQAHQPYPTMYPGYASQGPNGYPVAPIHQPSLQRNPSTGSRTSMHGEKPNGYASAWPMQAADAHPTQAEEDIGEFLHRIQSAIPDLQMLAERYRSTAGQLGVREEFIRKTELQKAEILRQKESYIESLAKQLEDASHKHSIESNKLRLEIGNLEEKQKEFSDRLAATETARTQLEEAKIAVEHEKEVFEKQAAEERERLQREFEEWKQKASEEFATEKSALEERFESQIKDQDETSKAKEKEIQDHHAKELETLQAEFEEKMRVLDQNSKDAKKELEDKLENIQKELDDVRNAREVATSRETEARENWEKEREELKKGWEAEKEEMTGSWEKERQSLIEGHETEKSDLQKAWEEEKEGFIRKGDEERGAHEKMREVMQKGWDDDKSKHERMVGELNAVAETLGSEKSKLQRMVEAFGEVIDLKSKGDAFYLDAFGQLFKQVKELGEEHFLNLPIAPSEEVLREVPPSMPSFLANTYSSRQLRAAYIQHTVSNILCYRVFAPFLFSLGRRYDKADSLFQAMSNELRHKSTRKEAIWRQHTLYAAYTASSAKKTINAAAGAVVDEIVAAIRPFADPKQMDAIYAAVRRIVKLAAETWRLARLEREMITAHMPAAEDEDETEDDWLPAEFNNNDSHSAASHTVSESSPPRKILLRLFPIITREPMHEGFRTDAEKNDNGCTYFRGVALYSDAQPVIDRLAELHEYTGTAPSTGPLGRHHSFGSGSRPSRSATPLSPLFPAKDEIGNDSVNQPSSPRDEARLGAKNSAASLKRSKRLVSSAGGMVQASKECLSDNQSSRPVSALSETPGGHDE